MTKIASTTPLSNTQIISLASSAGATSPVADVSDRYNFISTISVVDMLRDSGWLPVHAEESSVRKDDRKGFQKHLLRFSRPEFNLENESVQLILFNSHDKGTAFKLLAGVWRFVCWGLMPNGTKNHAKHSRTSQLADSRDGVFHL